MTRPTATSSRPGRRSRTPSAADRLSAIVTAIFRRSKPDRRWSSHAPGPPHSPACSLPLCAAAKDRADGDGHPGAAAAVLPEPAGDSGRNIASGLVTCRLDPGRRRQPRQAMPPSRPASKTARVHPARLRISCRALPAGAVPTAPEQPLAQNREIGTLRHEGGGPSRAAPSRHGTLGRTSVAHRRGRVP